MKRFKIVSVLLLAAALICPVIAGDLENLKRYDSEPVEETAVQRKTVSKFMEECVKKGFPATCFVSEVRTAKAFKGKEKKWEGKVDEFVKINIKKIEFSKKSVRVVGVLTDKDDDLESDEMEFGLVRRAGKWQICDVWEGEEEYNFKKGKWENPLE